MTTTTARVNVISAQAPRPSGVCYIRLGEYEKTVAHFEKVIEKWPDYEYAWSAQHLIGTYVNLLMKSGKIPASEAEPKIEAAWQAMIDNYPQKPLYDVALRKLGGFYLERGQPQKAVGYFETFCDEYPEDIWRAQVLYDLAGAYEDIGEAELAIDVYEEFIEDYPDDPKAAQAQDRLRELGGTD